MLHLCLPCSASLFFAPASPKDVRLSSCLTHRALLMIIVGLVLRITPLFPKLILWDCRKVNKRDSPQSFMLCSTKGVIVDRSCEGHIHCSYMKISFSFFRPLLFFQSQDSGSESQLNTSSLKEALERFDHSRTPSTSSRSSRKSSSHVSDNTCNCKERNCVHNLSSV